MPGEETPTRWRQAERVVSARVLDETVILDPAAERYTRLNGSAGVLWAALGEPRTSEKLAEALRAEYAIEPERARQDAAEFVERMAASGLVEPVQEQATS